MGDDATTEARSDTSTEGIAVLVNSLEVRGEVDLADTLRGLAEQRDAARAVSEGMREVLRDTLRALEYNLQHYCGGAVDDRGRLVSENGSLLHRARAALSEGRSEG